MLDLTENARTLIKGITDNTENAEGGVRISRASSETRKLEVTIAEQAADGDVVIEEAGARVLLGPVAARALEHKTLDATLADGAVTFSVLDQIH